MPEMSVLDSTGHTKTIWSKDKPEQIEAARDTFDKLRAKNYMAYRVDKDGDQGEIMNNFDPDAEKMILSPPIVGG